MGLLDLLQGDQSQSSSPLAGLLDLLRGNALNQAPAATGAPGDQANYSPAPMLLGQPQPVAGPVAPNQPSPLDSAAWPAGPVGAPSNANASMPAPQPSPQSAAPPAPMAMSGPAPVAAPAAPQPASPGLGDRLALGAKGFLGNMSGGPITALLGGLGASISGLPTDPATIAAQKTAAIQNANEKFLLTKGADPAAIQAAKGSPEAMTALMKQYSGPIQSLGNGYIFQNGKTVRAYTPDDKTPSGFAQDDNGTMHFVPGGPADPAYQKTLKVQSEDPNAVHVLGQGGELYKTDASGNPVVVHKNEKAGVGARILSDDGADLMADRIVNGEKGITTGFARSPADLAEIYNRVAAKAKERGIDASDILSNINNEYAAASASRTFGGMTAKQETYGAQTAKAIDIAEQASKEVPRTDYPDANKAILAYRNHTGDPKVAALGQALETLTQEYARAVGGGHGTVADKEEAREYLGKAQSHDQLVARLNVMRNEIARARESVGESAANVGQIYRNNIRGGAKLPEPGADGAAPAPSASGTTQGGINWSVH
jgi:hypothetical protein